MSRPSDELTPINVVPHFSRLHEWIALEERYFQDEGLKPHMLSDVMHSVSSHRGVTSTANALRIFPSSRSRRSPTRLASGARPATRAPVWVGLYPTFTAWDDTLSS